MKINDPLNNLNLLLISLILVSVFLVACSSVEPIETQNENKDENTPQIEVESAIDLNDEDKITLINKWHKDLHESEKFKLLTQLLNGYQQDPVLNQIIEEEGLDQPLSKEAIKFLSDWAINDIAHTQTLETFQSEKGKDPWGVSGGIPTYKKLLPSEMKAMSMFSGKYTGKCSSITNLLYSVLRSMGLESQDGLIVRLGNHTMGIFKLDNKVFAIDNNHIIELNQDGKDKLASFKYYGFYNDRLSYKGSFKITRDILEADESLLNAVMHQNKIEQNDVYKHSEGDSLAYVMQSLNIPDPSLYLKASKKGPNVIEMAKDLTDPKSIISWMEDSIDNSPVLKMKNSIQTADQTLVFQSGNTYDKGLLASTLMQLNNIDCDLFLTTDNAYIKYQDEIYSIPEKRYVNTIDQPILYTLN